MLVLPFCWGGDQTVKPREWFAEVLAADSFVDWVPGAPKGEASVSWPHPHLSQTGRITETG